MTVVNRAPHVRNYAIIDNAHLRDMGISLRAKGLLDLMLSLPDTWEYSIDGLCRLCKEGKAAIASTINELIKTGYIQRSQPHEGQKFARLVYIINEIPVPVDLPAEKSEPDSTQPDFQDAEKSDADSTPPQNQAQQNIDIQNTDLQNTDSQIPDNLIKGGRGTGESHYRSISQIRDQLDYDSLVVMRPNDIRQIDELVNLIQGIYCTPGDTITIEREDYSAAFVRERMDQLTGSHIEYVLDTLAQNRSRIRPEHMEKYLRTMLFKAPCTAENYTTARVAADLNSP